MQNGKSSLIRADGEMLSLFDEAKGELRWQLIQARGSGIATA